jgi:molybdopterin-guanine dinucleotide biosynthesis protein A
LVINAGGQSRRMGQPKALLAAPPDGEPLLAHIVRRLQGLATEPIIVIANDPQIRTETNLDDGVRWLTDRYIDVGPLGGIATALAAIEGWALIVACDMPLLNPALLAQMVTVAREENENGQPQWDAVVPVVNDYAEPLHALYHRRCLPAIAARLAAEERRAVAFLPDVRVRYLEEAWLRQYDPELRSFTNVNTPHEWAALRWP